MKWIFLIIIISAACSKPNDAPEPQITAITSFTPGNGYAGSLVTINGTNFSDVPAENIVKFNGKTATVQEASVTQLSVIVPDGATTGKITITNGGSTATSAGDFVVKTPINQWKQVASFPEGGRVNAAVFVIGNKAYVTTGIAQNYTPKDMWAYDAAANTWTQKADFAGPLRWKACGFALNGNGYICLGNGGALDYLADLWQYSPGTNTWSKKADFKGAGREFPVVFTMRGKAYVGLGSDGSATYKKDLWEYDPTTDNWSQKANFAGTAVTMATSFTVGLKGYVVGGYDGFIYKNDCWEYDVTSNSWSKKANMPGYARSVAISFTFDDKGFIATGFGKVGPSNSVLDDLWEYNTATDTWKQKATKPGGGRANAIGFTIGNKGYISMGTNSGYKNETWTYEY